MKAEKNDLSGKEKKFATLFLSKKKDLKEETKKTVAKPITKPVDFSTKKRKRLVIAAFVSLACLSLFLGYFTRQQDNEGNSAVVTEEAEKTEENEETNATENEVADSVLSEKTDKQLLLESVSRLMELPGGESPIVIGVADAEKLKDKSFSLEAQEDDQMVIFMEAEKAVVYRPSSGKIIDVIPFPKKEPEKIAEAGRGSAVDQVIESDEQIEDGTERVLAGMSEQGQEGKISVAVYNGTESKGISEKIAQEIAAANDRADIVMKVDAKGNYSNTIVIDLIGNNSEFVQDIALSIGGTVLASFPDGEMMPGAEVLVIGGEN